jgi:hypothetical protein
LFRGHSQENAGVLVDRPGAAQRREGRGRSEIEIAQCDSDSPRSEVDSESATRRLKALSPEIAHQLADEEGPAEELGADDADAVGEFEAELETELEAELDEFALDEALAEAEEDGPPEPEAGGVVGVVEAGLVEPDVVGD